MSRYLIFTVLIILFSSCKEEESLQSEIIDFTEVRITYIPIAADGCGYDIFINEELFKPINEEYLADKLGNISDTTLEMRYIDLKEELMYPCGWGIDISLPTISVLELRAN